MSLTSCNIICEAMPNFLENLVGNASSYSKRSNWGALESLIADYNTMDGMIPQVDQGNGQRRQVSVYYLQRATEDDVVTTAPANCDFDEDCYLKTTFDINDYAGINFSVEEDYMAEMCGGSGEQFQRLLMSKMDALIQKVDRSVFTSLFTGAGTNVFSGNSNEITHDILNASGQINASVLEQFLMEVKEYNRFHKSPMVIGLGSGWKANQLLKIGCCADGGIDIPGLADQIGWAFFSDSKATSILGNADSTLVIEPGTAKFVPWFKYRDLGQKVLGGDGVLGAFEMADGSMRGVMRDPITGLPFNIKVIHDSCKDKYQVSIFLNFDVWTQPSDIYAAADSFNGYTGILKYKFT